MKIYHLSDKVIWFGNHAGYDLLSQYIKEIEPSAKSILLPRNIISRGIGKLYLLYKGLPPGNTVSVLSEPVFRWYVRNKPDCIQHILYFEHHLLYMDRWKNSSKAPKNIIGTIHHPPIQWNDDKFKILRKLSSAIILYSKDVKFFEEYVGKDRVKFIRHGADTDFFKPSYGQKVKHILYVGNHRRNIWMLARIISRLSEKYPELLFDVVVPRRYKDIFPREMMANASIVWHHDISDEALLGLYQKSLLLLLPMDHGGANNSIVEALACGLPIVTTDIGGVRDYGGGSVYPVVANNDDDAMIGLIERYLSDSGWYSEVARECREFAEQNLAWPVIARKHLEAYRELVA